MTWEDNLVELDSARPGWLDSKRNRRYRLGSGTVQPCVTSSMHGVPWFYAAFGDAKYDRDKEVLSVDRANRAQPFVDMLNRGAVGPEECIELLNQHAYW